MCFFYYLYVSVGKQQVHDDVLGENFRVVDSEFDARKLLGQLLSLVLLPGLPDVVQQGVLKRSTVGDRQVQGGTIRTEACGERSK